MNNTHAVEAQKVNNIYQDRLIQKETEFNFHLALLNNKSVAMIRGGECHRFRNDAAVKEYCILNGHEACRIMPNGEILVMNGDELKTIGWVI